ncbi:alpha/beta fold hydrolase [Pseudonocardia nigra]|uniref:alpha/beta fold hydrolase n=1 Tax=Pseudonocardia nigra TaxID=1921578 RepID=UPI001C5FF658|nr:alpha/beta fold hydrolase [Pseudonocardia nigra]
MDAGVALDGRALHGTAWGAGPPVYLVHGWGGRSGQLGAFVAPLVAAGHRVVAMDAPAHGASGPGAHGRRCGSIPEFAAALRAAVAVHGRPHAVVAHSLGAAAAAHALREGVRPARLVLLAPVADPQQALTTFAARVGFGPRIRAGVERATERRLGLPWAAFDVPAVARFVAVPPTLVVHDRRDREVGFREGRAIADAWPGARLLATDGLGHRRLLRDDAVVADVVGFVADGAETRRSA